MVPITVVVCNASPLTSFKLVFQDDELSFSSDYNCVILVIQYIE